MPVRAVDLHRPVLHTALCRSDPDRALPRALCRSDPASSGVRHCVWHGVCVISGDASPVRAADLQPRVPYLVSAHQTRHPRWALGGRCTARREPAYVELSVNGWKVIKRSMREILRERERDRGSERF